MTRSPTPSESHPSRSEPHARRALSPINPVTGGSHPRHTAAPSAAEAVVAGSRLPSAPLHVRCLCRAVGQLTGRGGILVRQLVSPRRWLRMKADVIDRAQPVALPFWSVPGVGHVDDLGMWKLPGGLAALRGGHVGVKVARDDQYRHVGERARGALHRPVTVGPADAGVAAVDDRAGPGARAERPEGGLAEPRAPGGELPQAHRHGRAPIPQRRIVIAHERDRQGQVGRCIADPRPAEQRPQRAAPRRSAAGCRPGGRPG